MRKSKKESVTVTAPADVTVEAPQEVAVHEHGRKGHHSHEPGRKGHHSHENHRSGRWAKLLAMVIPPLSTTLQAKKVVDWAKPRVEHGLEQGKEFAAPAVHRISDAAAPVVGRVSDATAPRVDHTKSAIDDIMPRLTELFAGAVASATAARDEAVHHTAEAADTVRDEAEAQRRRLRKKARKATKSKKQERREALVASAGALSVVAVAGAVAIYMKKRAAEQDDPWATPIQDPYPAQTQVPETGAPIMAADIVAPPPIAADEAAAAAETRTAETVAVEADTIKPEDGAVAFAQDDSVAVIESEGGERTAVPPIDEGDTPPVAPDEVQLVDLTNDGMPPPDAASTETDVTSVSGTAPTAGSPVETNLDGTWIDQDGNRRDADGHLVDELGAPKTDER